MVLSVVRARRARYVIDCGVRKERSYDSGDAIGLLARRNAARRTETWLRSSRDDGHAHF